MDFYRSHVLVCSGTGCSSSSSAEIIEKMQEELKKNGLEQEIKIVRTGCFGLCEAGPIMVIYPEGAFYSHVQPSDVHEIVSEHLLKGRIVERLIHRDEKTHEVELSLNQVEFYKKQVRVALRNCGVIDPENIDEYIAFDGYKALGTCLSEKTPQDVIDIISASGLRGRGGGGFPTGTKWKFGAAAKGNKKYIVCNADEGDPGAFMDRSVLEGDPHSVIEAMAIAAYAIGSDMGYVYVRAEYPIAVKTIANRNRPGQGIRPAW